MRLFLRLNLFYGVLAFSIWGGYQLVPGGSSDDMHLQLHLPDFMGIELWWQRRFQTLHAPQSA